MDGLIDTATIEFRQGSSTTTELNPVTVGDPVLFMPRVTWEGGVADSFFFGGPPIVQYTAKVQRDRTTFLLRDPQVQTSMDVLPMPFDLRISVNDPLALRVADEWKQVPASRQAFSVMNFYQAARGGSAAVTVEAIDEDGDVVGSATATVAISKFVLSLQAFSLPPVKVGDSCSPAIVINLPRGSQFSTAEPLEASPSLNAELTTIVLFDLRQHRGGAAIDMPFDLILTVENDSTGINPVFFKRPDPPAAVAALGAGVFNGFPDYIVGRRSHDRPSTRAVISVQIIVKAGFQDSFDAAADQQFELRVLPRKLDLAFAAADGSPNLVIEDDWREDEGKLRGSFVIRASVEGHVLYRSDQVAVVAGHYSERTLVIDTVARRVGGGGEALLDRFHPSTTFKLEIEKDIVEFDVTHLDPSAGFFAVEHDVTDWISAKRDGKARVTCEIVPPDESNPALIPPDLVFWDLPHEVSQIPIEVKQPLRAHLLTWSDLHFSGVDAIRLDAGTPVQELIYAAGTLTGTIDNHNPASEQEIVKVIVDPPSGQTSETPVAAGVELNASGDVTVDVDGLDYDFTTDSGANTVTLSAWKPINEVMEGKADEAIVTLNAAIPEPLEILEPANDITVSRQRLSNIKYRYGLATRARLEDGSTQLAQNTNETYAPETRDTGEVFLNATPGEHAIDLVGYNDFAAGGEVFEEITIHAPAPTIATTLQLPADKSQEPNRVGHSITNVTVDATVTNAVKLEVWQGDDKLTTYVMTAGTEAEFSQVEHVTLPPSGNLAVGDNTFELRAINDFGTASRTVVVKRRAKICEAHGDPVFGYEARPAPGHSDKTVFLEVTGEFVDHNFHDFLAWTVNEPLNSSASDGLLGFVHDQFATFVDIDGERTQVPALVVETIGVVMTGPDFQTMTMLLDPEPSWVVSDPDTNESPIQGLFTSVITDPAIRQGGAMKLAWMDMVTLQRLDKDGNPA